MPEEAIDRLYSRIKRKKQKKSATNLNKEEIETLQSLQYNLGTVKVATNGFSDDNYLREGRFGTVYKHCQDGCLLLRRRLKKKGALTQLTLRRILLSQYLTLRPTTRIWELN
ncbi:cysteine-rich receptor-like protein kinase 27 [Spinacia oleracea]|uniref:Cysteine-rich receptor-like protein kinase 27 n=1 Tax=Spinacia oleracea TaxID=3562 RepID=A0A9R0J758_SPIOL|nr:cysteine-rich receptor-like protein kinase 27 [Spinacia oleracea]